MKDRSISLGRLPPDAALRVEEVCGRFEREWKERRRPELENYVLGQESLEYSVLLQELIWLDVHFRTKAGDVPREADYAQRFPTIEPACLANILANAVLAKPPTDNPDPAATITRAFESLKEDSVKSDLLDPVAINLGGNGFGSWCAISPERGASA